MKSIQQLDVIAIKRRKFLSILAVVEIIHQMIDGQYAIISGQKNRLDQR
jgi:hypothetical protein